MMTETRVGGAADVAFRLAVAWRLRERSGLVASIEYPGFVAVIGPGECWWSFGTANPPTWGGDCSFGGEVIASITLDVPVDCTDADTVAAAIARALVGPVERWRAQPCACGYAGDAAGVTCPSCGAEPIQEWRC
jgi:hypothetical protein